MSNTQLLAILKEARAEALKENSEKLVDCPYCGQILDWRKGVANCRFGHFRTAGGTKGSVKTSP